MQSRVVWTMLLFPLAAAHAADPARQAAKHWELKGDLSEACSCRVPCTCNFNDGPSPHHFCWTMFALDTKKKNQLQ